VNCVRIDLHKSISPRIEGLTMNESYEKFMDEWSNEEHHKDQSFIRDGIIDPVRWDRTDLKVMFLLKEAYDKRKRPEGFDLREIVREKWKKPKNKTWRSLSAWAYICHHAKDAKSLLSKIFSEQQFEVLRSCAIVNLKKSRGVSESKMDDIIEHTLRDKQRLLDQIALINPKIIVCGGTMSAVEKLYSDEDIEAPYENVWKIQDRYFVKFKHPAGRFSSLMNYSLGFLLLKSGAV